MAVDLNMRFYQGMALRTSSVSSPVMSFRGGGLSLAFVESQVGMGGMSGVLFGDSSGGIFNGLIRSSSVGNLLSCLEPSSMTVLLATDWMSRRSCCSGTTSPGDCVDAQGEQGACISGAITNQLLDGGSSGEYNLTEALLFLSHLMGDIHQPLHVGFTFDKGGNTIDVQYYTRKMVLHHDTHDGKESS